MSKKCKNVIIILLIGTILLPYFSVTNIAKADNISDYKNAIKYDACRQFYAENCTYMNDLGDTVQKRQEKLDS
jgi:hypothetical protein